MSYSSLIRDCVYETVTKYNKELSNKYGISFEELMNLFFDDKKVVESKKEKVEEKKEVVDNKEKELSKKSKKELQEMCEKLDINSKGNKKELIIRLIKGKTETIIDRIKTSITSIIIQKNKFDNYEHEPTGFVFNKNTKCVIGKQDSSGNVIELDDDDFEVCKQYKFKFNIPETIVSTTVVYDEEEDIIEEEDEEEDMLDDDDD